MKFLSITGPKADIDRVVDTYLSRYEIHLENALSELKTVKDLRPYIETNPYTYLISEFVDNFGPYPIESFLGENPVFNSEKDDYEFILKELKEAAAAINTSVLSVDIKY